MALIVHRAVTKHQLAWYLPSQLVETVVFGQQKPDDAGPLQRLLRDLGQGGSVESIGNDPTTF